MGIDDADTFEKQLAATTKPNGTIAYAGQFFFWIHGCGNTLWANESLVQSYTGAIRVAPVKRKFGARFANLRTAGAFLVSGEIRPHGDVAYLTIESEKGGACRVVRPWTEEVRVRQFPSMKPVELKWSNDELTFETTPGERYIVDRPTQPWEQIQLTDVPPRQG